MLLPTKSKIDSSAAIHMRSGNAGNFWCPNVVLPSATMSQSLRKWLLFPCLILQRSNLKRVIRTDGLVAYHSMKIIVVIQSYLFREESWGISALIRVALGWIP